MHDKATPSADVVDTSGLPDVNEIPLEDLLGADESVLTGSVRRLLDELDQSAENYAAHSSST
jgi:FXSXX-COOH protein